MNFYVRAYHEQLKDYYTYPCFILVTNSWDDYGFKTTFELQYYSESRQRFIVEGVKIMDIKIEGEFGKTILPDNFKQLEDNFCSLGISSDYYSRLKILCQEYDFDIFEILEALNDVACLPSIKENFEDSSAFRNSLLREREAKSALLLGLRIVKGLNADSDINFTFSTKLRNADFEHSVNFGFKRNQQLPKRIFAIVGKNGTGKTIFLSNLANALCYSVEKDKIKIKINEYETGYFNTPLGPPFGKVIAVSYSLFDTFKRPKPSKRFSYIYCGIRNDEGEIDKKQLQKRHIESLAQIVKKEREEIWIDTLNKFVDLKSLGYKYNESWPNSISVREFESKNLLDMSSGHSILVYTLTEIIANLSDNSLLLFDEPENHLHPNAIANLINSISDLLVSFKSFAIISTHSPIVIQQIPSSNVYVFERDNNTPITRPLDIESFGENLTIITKHIFETNEVSDGFKTHLKKLQSNNTFDEILEMFDNRLSLNAKIFLSSLYNDDEEINTYSD